MVKYKVVSGLNADEVIDTTVGIESFSAAQDIQWEKLAMGYQYCNVSYYISPEQDV